jgi:hypothetical protein
MPAIDNVTAAALQAALVLRCDDGRFAIVATTTNLFAVPSHVLQRAFQPNPNSVRLLVRWSAVYKGTPLGDQFVCDSRQQAQALNAMVDHANQILDAFDLKRMAAGFSTPLSAQFWPGGILVGT